MHTCIVIPSGDEQLRPHRANPTDAGLDLRSNESALIHARGRKLIRTGIHIGLPKDTYGQIAPRSGLSCKGIDIGAGVIDEDYRGEVRVLLINNSPIDYTVNQYDRIAQLIVIPLQPSTERVEEIIVSGSPDQLGDTSRGERGFGSSGIN